MLSKIIDRLDNDVSFVILVDSIEDLNVLADVMKNIGLKRLSYEVYKDDITAYMVEIRMPYNRYLAMMKLLRKNGHNLRAESKADIIQRFVKD